jgi:hypothetical protein
MGLICFKTILTYSVHKYDKFITVTNVRLPFKQTATEHRNGTGHTLNVIADER